MLTPVADAAPSCVYIIEIGRFVKIGYTTALTQRLKSFQTGTAETITVLATIPGGRSEEARLHRALAENRVRGEFFHFDHRLRYFIEYAARGEIKEAWIWLDRSTPENRRLAKQVERRHREAVRRATRTERNAHCARLVAERRAQLGW